MSRQKLTGSFVALITPFNRDGSVDFAAFRTLLTFHEDNGTAAVLIMGSTGETSMLSPEEKKAVIVETAKMKSARMPIFFGCTGANTEATIANLVVELDGALLTPALACGLLPGVLRGHLLEEGRVREGIVRVEDLGRANRLWLVSAVRGWREAVVVDEDAG